jgi:ABC-2 type transport system permease protein
VGVMLATYLGFVLLGAALLAIGMFASSLTQNQIVAAVIGMGITLLLWISGALEELVGEGFRGVVAYLPIFDHYVDMVRGIIDTKDVLYYLSAVVVFLFLSTRVLESRRWK